MSQLDALHHREFEHAIRDLMRRDGCADAIQVGGAGDNGADVKATDPFGRWWVIQCKHRRNGLVGSPVGTPDLHVLNGTARQLHGADVGVLVTNGRFTSGCPPLAKSQKLHLVDRNLLGEWAASGRPLWVLLRAFHHHGARQIEPPRAMFTARARAVPDRSVNHGQQHLSGRAEGLIMAPVAAGREANRAHKRGDSQAQSAGSIPVTRSRQKPQASGPGLCCCPNRSGCLAPDLHHVADRPRFFGSRPKATARLAPPYR
ncbi:restriction endonuclease [Streptomyces sp. MS2.AVA.5]|uniref:Restriction endonuclease n=1 Tax=Streptomyces achmelvichensis TaxID=3134111 RepID=A0ACC6PXR2_9ACTN